MPPLPAAPDPFSQFWERAMAPLANLGPQFLGGGQTIDVPGVEIHVEGDGAGGMPDVDPATGAITIPMEDGGLLIQMGGQEGADDDYGTDHNANLANLVESSVLGIVADDLLQSIEQDDRSRAKWLQDRANGIALLALALEGPRSDLTNTAGSMEGMSTVRNPLLLEAVLRFQANARGELLPANGPVKVKADSGTTKDDGDADALEADMNTYLTTTAEEYYPDTDKLLFAVGYGGCGFKKIYHCPVRRRPVSESVDAKDVIVNNSATSLRNASRITHVNLMSPNLLKRMQRLGVYRDIDLSTPTPKQNVVDERISKVSGVTTATSAVRPYDQDYTLYECLCELDLQGFEDRDEESGEPTGLKLPYRVTIDKDSREILEIRRNWDADDETKVAKRVFVKYSFVPGLGFYDLGLVNILGNATAALTAAWRVCLDSGMFSNFPGFVFSKQGIGRQITNEFRVPPGGGVGLDIGGGDIRQAVMPLPYSQLGPIFPSFIEQVQATLQRVGGTAEMNVGEGRSDAPVGTTVALIEQAKVVLDAVHKRLHAAQAEEFQVLKGLFREDPGAFFRHNKSPQFPRDKQRLLDALENNDLIPVADPNIPSSMHRQTKFAALMQIVQMYPQLFDIPMVVRLFLDNMKFDNPEELLAKSPPPPPPPDPRAQANEVKLQTAKINQQTTLAKSQAEAVQADADRKSKEQLKLLELARSEMIHPTQSPLASNPVIPQQIYQQ